MNRIVFFLIASTVFFSSCFHKKAQNKGVKKTGSFGRIYKDKDNEYRYKMAEQYYANKKYNYAVELYESLFPYINGTDRYEDMYYKYAYCFYYDNDYANAENVFKLFTEKFPASKRTEECEYMRAYCYYKQSPKVDLDQTNTYKAMSLMQAFINTHSNSEKVKEANDIMDVCREKLELKEFKNAELYYNLGYYAAAAIAYANVTDNFPDSKKADEYKCQTIRAYYKYAEMSEVWRQQERFQKVLSECTDFTERFAGSKYFDEVVKYRTQANNYLKKIKENNEQIKKTS
jgi:outer membrane protein assembly factor BamD